MRIENTFKIEDTVSGLKIEVSQGSTLDRLHVEILPKRLCSNRDFWFTKRGEFDGTGSGLCRKERITE